MEEYFVFDKKYVEDNAKAFDKRFLSDYYKSNKFPIERIGVGSFDPEIVIHCPSYYHIRWTIRETNIPMFGRIVNAKELKMKDIDDKLFEL